MFFYFMAQTELLYFHSPQWHENSMLLLIFSWSNYHNFNLFFTEYQGKAMMQNPCVPLRKLFFLHGLEDVEFLLKGGTTITLWILAIMTEKWVINVLMSYRQTSIVSALLCTENLHCEFNHSILKPHFQNHLLCELTHCILTQIFIS
jgi:hypothetical protein